MYDDQEKRSNSFDPHHGDSSSMSKRGRSQTMPTLDGSIATEGDLLGLNLGHAPSTDEVSPEARPGLFFTSDPSTSHSELPEHVTETL